MFRPLALYVGLRYTRAKRRNHFISFISLVSTLGIALGVMVLITVLSVMNGFDYQIRKQFFAIAPEVTILTGQDLSQVWPQLQVQVDAVPGVVASAPYVAGMAMLNHAGAVNGVNIVGIVPKEEVKVSDLQRKMVAGRLGSLKPGTFNIILGSKLANQLGLFVGDKVTVLTPQATTSPFGVVPQFRRFNVTGLFTTNSGFGFDSGFAYINMQDAAKLFQEGQNGLHIKIASIYQAAHITQQLEKMLPQHFLVTNWTEQYGPFFSAIAMEKTIMFSILVLIIAVAAFNLVSTLVMAVNDKRADIAILRTLGASPHTIMMIFVVQGAIIGIVGTLLGMVAGIILSLNATAIASGLQHLFNVQLIKSSVFFVDFLPSQLQWHDVVGVSITAFILSLVATIYPASVAFRTQPAEALRYE